MKKYIFQILSLIVFISCNTSANSQVAKVLDIDAKQYQEMVKDSNTVVIDVRTEQEIAEGIIPGASKFINVNGPNFETEILQLDSTKTYIVYCRSGARSSRAANIMVNKGFKNVCNLNGGISSWPGETVRKD